MSGASTAVMRGAHRTGSGLSGPRRRVTCGRPVALAAELDLGDAHADITDHDVYTRGVPHATFLRLREEDPVHFTEERDGRGFWSVTRYEDVLYVSRHTELFSSAKGIRLEDMDPEETEA